MKTCPNCHKNFSDETQFCAVCGTPLVQAIPEHFCPNCGTKIEPGEKFCPSCGRPSEERPMENAQAQMSAQPVQSSQSYQAGPRIQTQPPKSKMDMIKQDYFSFEGRLNRKPYIIRSFIIFAAMFILFVLSYILFGNEYGYSSTPEDICDTLVVLAAIVANLSISVRRLHDLNKTGWLFLLTFVPVLNVALEIYMLFVKGTEGPNQYGPDPLQNS